MLIYYVFFSVEILNTNRKTPMFYYSDINRPYLLSVQQYNQLQGGNEKDVGRYCTQ